METKNQLQNVIYQALSVLIVLFVSFKVNAQDKEIKISDGVSLVISENSFIKIPGNITLGEGLSGNLVMRGNTFEATGQLNVGAGSDLDITNGTFVVNTTNFNIGSTVTYDGANQLIKNWEYGHLVLNGTGNMSISGDVATPTICNTLTINTTGNSLIIPVNKALTINNAFTNNAGTSAVILESDSTGDGSLISYTSNVDATVNRYIKGDRWHYISAPVDNASLTNFANTNNLIWWDATMEWSGLGDYDPWKSVIGSQLDNAKGYAYYYYEDTINYLGHINVGNYTQTLYKSSTGNVNYQGWNLVGNPYTSILDWDAAVADGAIPIGTENAIYLFDDDAQDGAQANYRYYVPSSGGTYGVGTADADGLIPLGQAFFVKTNTDNVTLNIKKDYRVHGVKEFYKSNNGDLIRLEISNGLTDESIIRLIDNSTFSFDPEYDAHKMFPGDENIPQLYSIDIDEVLTAINSIPEIKEDTRIKIGIKALEGDININLKELSYYDYDVYIIDNFYNTSFNLTQNETFEFYHYGGQIDNRFYLTFQDLSSDIDPNTASVIQIYPNPTSSYIKLSNTDNSKFETITIHDANGKLFYMNNNAEYVDKIDLSNYSAGVYFIKIQTDNNTIYHNRIILQK